MPWRAYLRALADEERAEAEWIADGDDRILGEEEQRIRAAHALERRLDALERGYALLAGDEVEQQLGVARALEDRALALELGADLLRVDEVPVVGDRDGADRALEVEGLRVLDPRLAGSRVAGVADGRVTRQLLQGLCVEHVRNEAHPFVEEDLALVEGGDAGRLLPAVLKGMDAEVREIGGLGMAKDAEDAALVVELVGVSVCSGLRPPPVAGKARSSGVLNPLDHIQLQGPLLGRGRRVQGGSLSGNRRKTRSVIEMFQRPLGFARRAGGEAHVRPYHESGRSSGACVSIRAPWLPKTRGKSASSRRG